MSASQVWANASFFYNVTLCSGKCSVRNSMPRTIKTIQWFSIPKGTRCEINEEEWRVNVERNVGRWANEKAEKKDKRSNTEKWKLSGRMLKLSTKCFVFYNTFTSSTRSVLYKFCLRLTKHAQREESTCLWNNELSWVFYVFLAKDRWFSLLHAIHLQSKPLKMPDHVTNMMQWFKNKLC